MSNVTMTLKEYNDLMDKFHAYEEIINAMTTPVYDKWSMEWYNNNQDSSMSLRSEGEEGISKGAKKVLHELISKNANEFMKDHNVEGTLQLDDNIHMNLGYVVRKQEDEE